MKKVTKKRPGRSLVVPSIDLQPSRQRIRLTSGQALKTVRQLQEMTQAQLAEASGIAQGTISAMEHDRVSIGVERARQLARALRVHPGVIAFPEWDPDAATP